MPLRLLLTQCNPRFPRLVDEGDKLGSDPNAVRPDSRIRNWEAKDRTGTTAGSESEKRRFRGAGKPIFRLAGGAACRKLPTPKGERTLTDRQKLHC